MCMISSYIIRIGDYNEISFVGGHFLSLHLHSNNDNFLSRRQQLFCNQIYIKVYCSAIFYVHNYSNKREIFSYEKKTWWWWIWDGADCQIITEKAYPLLQLLLTDFSLIGHLNYIFLFKFGCSLPPCLWLQDNKIWWSVINIWWLSPSRW